MPHLEVITHRTRLGSLPGLLLLLSVLTHESLPVITSHNIAPPDMYVWTNSNHSPNDMSGMRSIWLLCETLTFAAHWLYASLYDYINRLNTNSVSQQFGHGAPRVRKSSWGSTLLSFQAPGNEMRSNREIVLAAVRRLGFGVLLRSVSVA